MHSCHLKPRELPAPAFLHTQYAILSGMTPGFLDDPAFDIFAPKPAVDPGGILVCHGFLSYLPNGVSGG